MISLDEAVARVLALAAGQERRAETVTLAQAAGRHVLSAVTALRDQPTRPLAAMDGYAVAGEGSWQVIGESAAGHAFGGSICPGQAVRIFTGAVVPDGAVSVIMQEDITRDGDCAVLGEGMAMIPGKHIRAKASDFAAGDVLIPAGSHMGPVQLALAASGGHGSVSVAPMVRVAILSTGDELRPPGEPCAEDQIPASNGIMLAALLARPGVEVVDMGIIPDTREALAEALDRVRHFDMIVTIGGASVGDHDLVRPALLEAGASIDFWKVAMRPGKPLMAGTLGDTLVIGLPGNPVSAYVTALLFAAPALDALRGHPAPALSRGTAIAAEGLPANGPRTDHVRGVLRDGRVKVTGLNDSAALVALSQANILIVREAHAPPVSAGDVVPIVFIA